MATRARVRAGVVLAVAVVVVTSCATASAQYWPRAFSGTYASESWTWDAPRGCGNTAPFAGNEPISGTGYPVFVYLPGTGETANGLIGRTISAAMASRGFVAASVSYPEWQFYAEGIEGNAACVFGRGSSSSALAQLCARPAADCSKGVVVAGFSQGATIAARARNHDPDVRAAYLLGYLEDPASPWEGTARWTMATVPPAGTRALPDDRIRIVDGLIDAPPARRTDLNALSGRTCAVIAFSCLGPNGSGWYVVQHRQVLDGLADHCYFQAGGSCRPEQSLDLGWLLSTRQPWALQPNLAWLASFTG